MESQSLELNSKIYLDNVKLESNKDMDIHVEDKNGGISFLKIANMDGKILILSENIESIIFDKWAGNMSYRKKLSEIGDIDYDEIDTKVEEYYKKLLKNLRQ